VDDHPPNLALLMHLLVLHGYSVATPDARPKPWWPSGASDRA
jgi:hypothetical protein